MTGLTDRHWFLLAVLGYGLSTLHAVFVWRKGFRTADRVTYGILAASFAAQTTAMVQRGFSLSRCPVNNLFEAMMFVMWTMVAVYLVIGLFRRLRFVGAFASPALLAMGVFALMPALDHPANPDVPRIASLHAAFILLAYGAFGLSSVAAVMYLTEEHDLKFRKARTILSLLPPIQRLELVVKRLLMIGFIFLTIGLAMAPFLFKDPSTIFSKGDPKIIWSAFVWLIYATLVSMRWWSSQSGRRFAWGAVGSFSFVLLTFWGVSLLSKAHQP